MATNVKSNVWKYSASPPDLRLVQPDIDGRMAASPDIQRAKCLKIILRTNMV